VQPLYVYIHDCRSSGVVRNALTYARRIAEDRPTTVVAGYGEGLFRADAERGPFNFVALAERAGRAPRLAAVPRLRGWLRRQPPGVLLSAGNHGHPTAVLAAQGGAHRRIYRISNEVAGPIKGDRWTKRLWLRFLMRDAARIVLVGAAMSDHALFAEAVAAGRAVAIPNGVDRARACALAAAASPHPWLEEGVPTVIAVGRLRPQKRLDLLIAAAGLVHRERRVRLIILGGGSADEQVRMRMLGEAALGPDFLLAGETDNVFAWVARADVFALPSRWEGSSMALLEALAVETPVVAARIAGDAARVLADGRYGALFDGDLPAGLAEAIRRQLSDAAVLPGGRADAYSIQRTADRYADLIAEVAG
jgi:glycosyltransferase involved in cell wall biosynthesis